MTKVTKKTVKTSTKRSPKKVETKAAKAVKSVAPVIPDFKVISNIVKIDNKIKELAEKRKVLANRLLNDGIDGTFAYPLTEPMEGKKFMNVHITNNNLKLANGEEVYTSVGFKPLSVKATYAIKPSTGAITQ